jgi:putative phosphoesterase
MKVAALYDIHGNLPALNAVLEELKAVQPDLIVIGGDIVSGPMPAQTLQRLFQLRDQIRGIRGNGDREVVLAFDGQPIIRRYLPPVSEKSRTEIQWFAAQLSREQRDFLAELPERMSMQVEGLGSVLFCHATASNDEEIFTPITPAERLSEIFSHVEEQFVVCGHTHMQFERQAGNVHILNAGSVGMPYADQPGAYWLLLSSEGYEFRRTAYDVEAAAKEIRASGSPDAQEFAEENVLKVPSAAEATKTFERMAQEYRQPGE